MAHTDMSGNHSIGPHLMPAVEQDLMLFGDTCHGMAQAFPQPLRVQGHFGKGVLEELPPGPRLVFTKRIKPRRVSRANLGEHFK